MEIIVKNNSILRHQIDQEVAKPVALNMLKKSYQQENIKATDKWWRGRVDVQEAAKNAKVYKTNLERVNPETLSPQAKDIMWRRAKVLKDEFVVGMLSKEELHPVKGFKVDGVMKWVVDEDKIKTYRSVERNTAWLKQNEGKIKEFKNIMRHLNPENPNAGDIEKFRPKCVKL